MIDFACRVCRTPLQVEDDLAGQVVRCPNCLGTMTVPAARAASVAATSQQSHSGAAPERRAEVLRRPPPGGPGRRYGFNCPYCSSRLEANESMAGSEGTCPTCGSTISVPMLDRFGRLIDPLTKEIIKPDPHPVHAYAAAGERAPRLVKRADGQRAIQCSRCGVISPVSANNCASCGMPFTMEGTTPNAGGSANGVCVTSLVLGIIGIPASCTVLVPVLAIGFGVAGLLQSRSEGDSGRGFAIAGIICGAIGLALTVLIYL